LWPKKRLSISPSIHPNKNFFNDSTAANATVTGVPDLSTWTKMIIGFGGVGSQLRCHGDPAATTA
jgi:hypothetical protein